MKDLNEYLPNVNLSIRFIESNINRWLKLADVANEAYLSTFHFHRIFHAITGMTIKSYILKRRMSEAAKDLISTDQKLYELSRLNGFRSQESFTRAFSKIFEISPSRYRKFGVHVGIMEPIEINAEFKPINGIGLAGPSLVTLPTRYYIGIERNGLNDREENGSIFYTLQKRRSEVSNSINGYHSDLSMDSIDKSGKKNSILSQQ